MIKFSKKSKIKKHFYNRRFSISSQIALIFGISTFVFVACFSFCITAILRSSVLHQKSEDLLNNSVRLCTSLSSHEVQNELKRLSDIVVTDSVNIYRALQNSYDLVGRVVRQERIPYYISYTLYYKYEGICYLLASNDPYLPLLQQTENFVPRRYYEKAYYADGDLNILYLTLPSGIFYVQSSVNMDTDSIDKMLSILPIIMIALSLPLIAVSFLSARLFAARLLHPVAEITRTAKEISASNLDRRIAQRDVHDELQELGTTFNDLFARLQADFEREKRFTSDVSHELRTPLAVLLGHLDLLRRWGKSDPKILDSSLETLYTETKSMQALIENLLLLSRSERQNQPEMLIIRLKPLLKKLIDDQLLIAPEVQFTLECEESATLFTNSDILVQILRILITNSIAYSEKPAKICIKFVPNPKQLLICDKGFGIDAKDIEHIFDRLYRTDESRNKNTGGSGLGLAIAKTLVQNLGGTIKAQSEGTGKGTTMKITFDK